MVSSSNLRPRSVTSTVAHTYVTDNSCNTHTDHVWTEFSVAAMPEMSQQFWQMYSGLLSRNRSTVPCTGRSGYPFVYRIFIWKRHCYSRFRPRCRRWVPFWPGQRVAFNRGCERDRANQNEGGCTCNEGNRREWLGAPMERPFEAWFIITRSSTVIGPDPMPLHLFLSFSVLRRPGNWDKSFAIGKQSSQGK